MKKRRQGFNLIWKLCAPYATKIKLKRKGEYNKNNQMGGEMFSLPREVSLTGLQAGTIMRKCYKAGATKSQLETVRKTLSYAYQLTSGLTGNYEEVGIAWTCFDPRRYGAPTQRVMPVRIISPNRLGDAFLKEWCIGCGMDMPEWCVGGNITWDWCLNGGRSKIDLKKLKKSLRHDICAAEGWMRTEFDGGRSKLEQKKGLREWWGYRACLCPNGKHVGIPQDFWKSLDERGNPTAGTPFCTTCPLNMAEFVFRLLPSDQHRLYPRWLRKTCRFAEDDVGQTKLVPLANHWLRAQGANPDVEDYCSNGGRKALARVCTATGAPYKESYEVHGDLPKTWHKFYQKEMEPDRSFKRRTQSRDADQCLKFHRRFAMFIGRGAPAQQPLKLSRTDELLALIARNQGAHREVAQILFKT